MAEKEKILTTIFEAIEESNSLLPPEQHLEKSIDTVFMGDTGVLDSLGLITFIGILEQKIEKTFGEAITLTDENAMNPKISPFRNVNTLVDYIGSLLKK